MHWTGFKSNQSAYNLVERFTNLSNVCMLWHNVFIEASYDKEGGASYLPRANHGLSAMELCMVEVSSERSSMADANWIGYLMEAQAHFDR